VPRRRRSEQLRPQPPKLMAVNRGKLAQHFHTEAGCENTHKASVARTRRLANQAPLASALDQADDGVVALLKKLGKLGNRGPARSRKAPDPE